MVSAIIGTVHAVYCDQTFDAPLDLVGSSNWALYLANFAFRRPRWYSVATWVSISIDEACMYVEYNVGRLYLEQATKTYGTGYDTYTFVFLGSLDLPFDLRNLL